MATTHPLPFLSFSEQVARMRQRRRELLEMTNAELEELEQQLEVHPELERRIEEAAAPLRAQIAELRGSLDTLVTARGLHGQDLGLLSRQLMEHHAKGQELIDALGQLAQQAQGPLPMPAAQPASPAVRPTGARSLKHVPAAAVPALRQAGRSLPQAPAPKVVVEEIRPPKRAGKAMRTFFRRSFVAAALVAGVAGTWHLTAGRSQLPEVGKVAGASTDPAVVQPAAKQQAASNGDYPEEFANVPYADSMWAQFKDVDYGMAVPYAENAMHLVHNLGGSNVWFLRQGHYLLKVSRFALGTPLPASTALDTWWSANQADYTQDGGAQKGTFHDAPAWVVTPTAHTENSGTTTAAYFNQAIYVIWAKDEPAGSDDGRRQAKMLAGMQFLNP